MCLLDSVSDEPEGEVKRVWVEDAKQRLDDVRAGRTQVAPWDEARERIFARG